MTAKELLIRDCEYSFGEFMKALEGVTEAQAWAALPNLGPDYLHTDATIYAIVLPVAGTTWMNGSVCFRNTEIRWREIADQIEAFEPSWEAALDYLERAHLY